MEKSPSNGAAAYEYPVRKEPKPFNFWRGIYNKDKNYILGRTPKNWGKYHHHFRRLAFRNSAIQFFFLSAH